MTYNNNCVNIILEVKFKMKNFVNEIKSKNYKLLYSLVETKITISDTLKALYLGRKHKDVDRILVDAVAFFGNGRYRFIECLVVNGKIIAEDFFYVHPSEQIIKKANEILKIG